MCLFLFKFYRDCIDTTRHVFHTVSMGIINQEVMEILVSVCQSVSSLSIIEVIGLMSEWILGCARGRKIK